jgi:TPR repeat protein
MVRKSHLISCILSSILYTEIVFSCLFYLMPSSSAVGEDRPTSKPVTNISDIKKALLVPEKRPTAEQQLIDTAEEGDSSASKYLGDLYARGDILAGDANKAIYFYKMAIKGGDHWAEYALANLYMSKPQSPEEKSVSTELYKNAAIANIAPAKVRYASALVDGWGVPPDTSAGISILNSLVDQGNVEAMRKLGEVYSSGKAGDVNGARVAELYARAADLGDAKSAFYSGALYESGKIVPLDAGKAFTFYNRAAEGGIEEAKLRLASFYLTGTGTAKDYNKASEILLDSALVENPAALKLLGDVFSDKQNENVNLQRAVEFYKRAGDKGNGWGYYKAGSILRRGSGIHYDIGAAISYFRTAAQLNVEPAKSALVDMCFAGFASDAELKYCVDILNAQRETGNGTASRRLGDVYMKGLLGKVDPKAAVEAYKAGAANGDSLSMLKLGDLLSDKKNGPTEPKLALSYYADAIAAGDQRAVLSLARGHLNRRFGSLSKPSEGIRLLKTAVDQNPQAVVELANTYVWGKGGIRKNPERALSMLEQASSAGNVFATSQLVAYYRDGAGKKLVKMPKKARQKLLERAAQFDEFSLNKEMILLDGATSSKLSDYERLDKMLLDKISPEARPGVLATIRRINSKAYLYIAQSSLFRSGFFDGVADGILTKKTTEGFRQMCKEASLPQDCRRDPMGAVAVQQVAIIGGRAEKTQN